MSDSLFSPSDRFLHLFYIYIFLFFGTGFVKDIIFLLYIYFLLFVQMGSGVGILLFLGGVVDVVVDK